MANTDAPSQPSADEPNLPLWTETTVSTVGPKGATEVRALVHEYAPGLAITAHNFGTFEVTHIASGKRVRGSYERWVTAAVQLLECETVARLCGFSWTDTPTEDTFKAGYDKVLPWGNNFTVQQWFQVGFLPDDEFPWEDMEDSPHGTLRSRTRMLGGSTRILIHGGES